MHSQVLREEPCLGGELDSFYILYYKYRGRHVQLQHGCTCFGQHGGCSRAHLEYNTHTNNNDAGAFIFCPSNNTHIPRFSPCLIPAPCMSLCRFQHHQGEKRPATGTSGSRRYNLQANIPPALTQPGELLSSCRCCQSMSC